MQNKSPSIGAELEKDPCKGIEIREPNINLTLQYWRMWIQRLTAHKKHHFCLQI